MIKGTIALTKGVRIEFERTKRELESNEDPSLFNTIASVINSESDREQYGIFGSLPSFREWVGEKQFFGIKDFDFTIINKDWEGSVEVDRNEIEDDQVGMVLPRIRMLTMRGINHRNELLSALLTNGTVDLSYDGTAFFANTHTDGTGDNLAAGTGTTIAQLETDLEVQRATVRKFLDDKGEPLGGVIDTIVCPPELEMKFMKIMQSVTAPTATAAGVTNAIGRTLKQIIVDERLTDVDDWYAFVTSFPLRPLVFQDRKSLTLVSQNLPTDEAVFNRRKFRFSAEARYNTGYGLWQMAIKVVN